jgi:hypothetical protein
VLTPVQENASEANDSSLSAGDLVLQPQILSASESEPDLPTHKVQMTNLAERARSAEREEKRLTEQFVANVERSF